jgi:hypothetical protein
MEHLPDSDVAQGQRRYFTSEGWVGEKEWEEHVGVVSESVNGRRVMRKRARGRSRSLYRSGSATPGRPHGIRWTRRTPPAWRAGDRGR